MTLHNPQHPYRLTSSCLWLSKCPDCLLFSWSQYFWVYPSSFVFPCRNKNSRFAMTGALWLCAHLPCPLQLHLWMLVLSFLELLTCRLLFLYLFSLTHKANVSFVFSISWEPNSWEMEISVRCHLLVAQYNRNPGYFQWLICTSEVNSSINPFHYSSEPKPGMGTRNDSQQQSEVSSRNSSHQDRGKL